MRGCSWTLLAVLTCVSGEYLMGGHLDNNAGAKSRSGGAMEDPSGRRTLRDDLDLDLTAEESTVATTFSTLIEDDNVPSYHISYPFAFNGGKPFSLEKDPITGKIDFEKTPPVQALNYTDRNPEHGDQGNDPDEEIDGEESAVYPERRVTKDKNNDDFGANEINTYAHNFHDSLPVQYSSDKYGSNKYPLISNSYANTKVQSGANSYSTYNHRPYHPENDVYVLPTKIYASAMPKTSTYRTTLVIDDLNVKWISPENPSAVTTAKPPITASSPRTAISVSTKAPVITTWKPSTVPAVLLHSIDFGVGDDNEQNTLPIEKLQATAHQVHRNPTNDNPAPPVRQSPKDDAAKETQTATRYGNRPNLDNVILHTGNAEVNPSQDDDYYGEMTNKNDDDGSFDDIYLNLPQVTSTTVSTTSSTATSTVGAINAASTARSTTTVRPLVTSFPMSSSISPALQENVIASSSLQLPSISSSSSSNDRRQSATERHEHRPTSTEQKNKIDTGIAVESSSNIIVPPDQDTISFVLGNRQNVDGGYYSVGTAIGENPYVSLPDTNNQNPLLWQLGGNSHGPTKQVEYGYSPVIFVKSNSDHIAQKWRPPSPEVLKSSNELEPTRTQGSAVSTTVEGTKDRNKETNSGLVVFPDAEDSQNKNGLTKEHVVIINAADDSIRELPPRITLAAANKTTKIDPPPTTGVGENLPQLYENLTPPAENARPNLYQYHYHYDTLRPEHPRPPVQQRLPPPPRIKPHSPPLDTGVRRRPYSPDAKLPNILPQFRPNAKASHGHRLGSDAIGTVPAAQNGTPTRTRQPVSVQNHPPPPPRKPLPPPLSYLQRLNPPPPPIHAIRLAFVPTSKVDSVVLPHEPEPPIRRYRPSHVLPISRGNPEEKSASNRLFDHGAGQQQREEEDNGDGNGKKQDRGKNEVAEERERESSERYPEEPPMTPPRPPLFPKRRTADPPRVTTLQMIQQHGELGENEAEIEESMEPAIARQAERRKSDSQDSQEMVEQPIYVVYPVNTAVNIHPDDSKEQDSSVVVGTRGPQRPLPPDTLLQDEREKVHTVYNGRPVAPDFPYPLERPDPSSMFPVGMKETPLLVPSEQRQQQAPSATANDRENERNEQQDAINVIPYLQDFVPFQKKNDAAISVTLHRAVPMSTATSASTSMSTSTPIAYVYTPTRTAAHLTHRLDDEDDDSDSENNDEADVNMDANATILLPSQQPSSSSSSAPAPQNFMAPFIASMSAEAPTKNGWSVVVVDSPSAAADKRIDGENDETKLGSEGDAQTMRNEFDADNFKPQLFGGFQPIYDLFPTENTEVHDTADANTETDMPGHPQGAART